MFKISDHQHIKYVGTFFSGLSWDLAFTVLSLPSTNLTSAHIVRYWGERINKCGANRYWWAILLFTLHINSVRFKYGLVTVRKLGIPSAFWEDGRGSWYARQIHMNFNRWFLSERDLIAHILSNIILEQIVNCPTFPETSIAIYSVMYYHYIPYKSLYPRANRWHIDCLPGGGNVLYLYRLKEGPYLGRRLS
jgi:hypothetical protein